MKPSVKYGLLNGGLAILWTLFMYVTGLNRSDTGQSLSYLSLIIPVITIYLAIREVKNGPGEGWISFGKAFRTGMGVVLLGAIIGSLFFFLYITTIDTGFIDYAMEMQYEKMTESGMSDDQIDMAMKQSAAFMTPGWMLAWGFIGSLLMGTVVALIMAGILKKQDPNQIG